MLNLSHFKEKPIFLKVCNHGCRSEDLCFKLFGSDLHRLSRKPSFLQKTFNQAMNGNQDLPKYTVNLSDIAGRTFPFINRSLSWVLQIFLWKKHIPESSTIKPLSTYDLPHPRPQRLQNNKPSNNCNNYNSNSRPQSPNYDRHDNRSRQPFSKNGLRNVQNYIVSILDQEPTDDTMYQLDTRETQKGSEEQLL